jgi:hypothetical protein
MKYPRLAYHDAPKFDALSGAELDALVSQCPRHDAALRASGHPLVPGSIGPLRATATVRPAEGFEQA